MNKKANLPIYSQQLGAIRASVWESVNDDGRTYHNVAIVRSYKDKNGDWQESSSFNGLADLALVREAARLAASWIEERELQLESHD